MAASLVLPLCRFTQTYPTSETAVEVEHLLSQGLRQVASTDTAYPSRSRSCRIRRALSLKAGSRWSSD